MRPIIVLVALLASIPAAVAQQPASDQKVWYEGSRVHRLTMAADGVAVVFEAADHAPIRADAANRLAQSTSGLVLQEQKGAVAFFKLSAGETPVERARALRAQPGVRHASPVFYEGGNERRAMALSGRIIVGFKRRMDAATLADFASRHGITLVKQLDFSPDTFVFDARQAADSLALANAIYRSGEAGCAYPDWIRALVRR